MRVLVLGGSMFVSHATAAEAVRRGHDVVAANRGRSGTVPEGVRHLAWDRTEGAPPPFELAEQPFDAVVDVARMPSWVRTAVAAWPRAHWSLVSTVNVYTDDATPGQTPASGPLQEPQPEDVALDSDEAAYGRMKVACEQLVTEGAAAAFVVRPGLIAGPGDPSGRFSYWPERIADGGEVLAPGDPSDVVQVVDARDLAAWIVNAFESGATGTYDGVGAPTPLGDLLSAIGPGVSYTWVPSGFLSEQGVEPWAGARSVPLWLPRPEYDGMMAHDVAPSLAAGLVLRPVAETSTDTLTWLRATPDAVRTGLTRDEELEVLAAWRSSTGHSSGG